MTIEAKSITGSVTSHGAHLATLQLCYPRFIHAEFLTHRVFSRNASSSRAIPVAKMLEQVRTDPAMPIHWGKNQPGMQAKEELERHEKESAQAMWGTAAMHAANAAEEMNRVGAHKQIVNRILEPFQHIHVVVTATEWDNFFQLRDHPDAQPEMQALAKAMRRALDSTVFYQKDVASDLSMNWHLPYISQKEISDNPFDPIYLAKLSAARCARVSYLNHDGTNPDPKKDMELYYRLIESHPRHASPVEHQGLPASNKNNWSNNFRGWIQFRELIERGHQ